MKKVFIDTNILLDFFDHKRSQHDSAKELVYFLLRNKIKIVFSEDMISTIIYLVRKDKEAQRALITNFDEITYDSNIIICSFGEMVIRNACNFFLKNGGDFEDVLQYFCAEKEGCCAIYSSDMGFPNLKIPVKRYGDFNVL